MPLYSFSAVPAAFSPYLSDRGYLFADYTSTTFNSANVDHLMPVFVRDVVTIDALLWSRSDTTAANCYLGLLDSGGNLLTDCAVDAVTTTGIHSVSCTAITLAPKTLYYAVLNMSVATQGRLAIPVTSLERTDWGYSAPLGSFSLCQTKARTNAVFPSTTTLTGWTASTSGPLMGFVPV